MAVDTIPAGGISLHGSATNMDANKHLTKSAMLFSLSQSMLNDLKKAANGHGGLQLTMGKAPKLQLGSRSIDLSVSPDAFRNELYTSNTPNDFNLNAVISHRAELHPDSLTQSSTAGADAALATLQNTLASYEQEKKAKATTISENVLPEYRNRFEAARKQKKGGLLGMHSSSGATSPSLSGAGTPRPGLAATSAPSDSAMRTQAMRTPAIHLLAMKAATTDDISKQTHIPRNDLEIIVSKVAQQNGEKWELTGKVYKELDVWAFGYKTQDDRQMAIDNAIKALDRQRIGKEDKLWQMLLPKEERGKGRMLSRLHLGAGQPSNKGLTPNWAPSPHPQTEDDEKIAGAADTPRIGPSAATPKAGAAKSNATDMKKRLLSKDPKKARAAEEAKEKKKRGREAAASDREGAPAKRQKQAAPASKVPSKVKSAELVHSSDDDDDDEEGEIKETPSQATSTLSQPATKPALKPRPKPSDIPSPDSSDDHVKKPVKPATKASALANKPKASTPLAKNTASPALKSSKTATAGKATPNPASKTSTAPKQTKTQLSPSKAGSRPSVPSPLGAARPRLASDVSDRSGIGIRKTKPPGAETPKGLHITTAAAGRKRQDTVTSRESGPSSDGNDKKRALQKPTDKTRKIEAAAARAINTPAQKSAAATPNATSSHKLDATGTKRKAVGAASQQAPTPKHRKTESSSSSSQLSQSSSSIMSAANRTTATNGTKPANANSKSSGSFTSPESSDTSTTTATSVIDTITFAQGVTLAQKFREEYYPRYAKLYDSLQEKEANGETVSDADRQTLWEQHRRLAQMKREIEAASEREGEA